MKKKKNNKTTSSRTFHEYGCEYCVNSIQYYEEKKR